jgi:hypothetical protein
MGAFNQWVKGSCLEPAENRRLATVAMNLLLGASVLIRTNWLRHQGALLPAHIGIFRPKPYKDLLRLLQTDISESHML